MREKPRPQEIYRHFKGKLYQIMGIARDSEDGKEMVVYQALYGEFQWYVRELSMFMSEVDHEKYPEAKQKYRFERYTGEKENENQREQVSSRETLEETEMLIVPLGENLAEGELDPLVIEFLDADSYEKKINILTALHHRMTDEMITTLAIASDIEIPKGDLEQRYEELRRCLVTKDRFEIKRY